MFQKKNKKMYMHFHNCMHFFWPCGLNLVQPLQTFNYWNQLIFLNDNIL